jgi:two-component system, OmpR family, sensor histidine kinase VicK
MMILRAISEPQWRGAFPGNPLLDGPAVGEVVASQRREADQSSPDGLAVLGHELRTPVTVIKGYAQLLQRRGVYDVHAVEQIVEQADRMARLLHEVLDVSTLKAGRLPVNRVRTDLVSLAHSCADEARALTESHSIVVEAPTGPLEAHVDPERVRQVLENLLSNAVKYSPDGGDIRLRVEDRRPVAKVSVQDQGLGIAPEALPSVFDCFYRDAGTARVVEGAGLGLYIARQLVEAHGGHIWAESPRPGRGSTFCLTLPLLKEPW